MTTMTAPKLQIPLVDLSAQYATIREEILEAINSVLDSSVFVNGTQVESFEAEFAAYIGRTGAVGVSSGTAALELAMKSCDIGAGDEVIVPANTFFATAEAVSNVGATPVFADVDPTTAHMDIRSAERCITARTRAIIPVHLFGRAMDLAPFEALTQTLGLELIEDAAQAHGSMKDHVRVGGAGRLCCFSFYPGKNLGAYGDAGAVTCADAGKRQKLRVLRDHGSPAKYQHSVVGTNARLDEIQAAVLRVKLRYLDQWNAARVRIARWYADLLTDTPVSLPFIPPDGEQNFHLFVIRSSQRDALIRGLQERGISTGVHYPTPLHLTDAYLRRSKKPPSLPVAECLSKQIVSLPMFAELTTCQVEAVAEAIKDISRTFEAQIR